MISVARIAMCKPVAAAHSRGLLRTVFVVGVSSNALRKMSFCVVGDRRTGRAGFPVGPAWAVSKRCIGWVVIGPPFRVVRSAKGLIALAPPIAFMTSHTWRRSYSAHLQTAL